MDRIREIRNHLHISHKVSLEQEIWSCSLFETWDSTHIYQSVYQRSIIYQPLNIPHCFKISLKCAILSYSYLYFLFTEVYKNIVPNHELVFFCPASGCWEFSTLMRTFHFSCCELLRSQAEGQSIWEDWNMKSGKAESRVASWIGTYLALFLTMCTLHHLITFPCS